MIDEVITNIVIVLFSRKHSEAPSLVRGEDVYCVEYRVIQERRSVFWEVKVSVIVRKKFLRT